MPTDTPWKIRQKIFFRFIAIYFTLYIIFFLLPDSWWHPIVKLTGRLVGIRARSPEFFSGSGDGLYAYIQAFSFLITAGVGCIIWSIFDSKRKSYNHAFYWLLVLVRYYLAFFLIVYGLGKCFNMQFRPPEWYQLEEPYGMFTPMGLAWKFLGYSKGYTLFIGISQTLAGILLFFRRTVLLAALLAIVVMSNVFAVNLFFDVPVKLFSLHLLLMAILVTVPDISRLYHFLFGYQLTSRRTYVEINWLDKHSNTKEWLKVLLLLIVGALITVRLLMMRDGAVKDSLLSGIYKVIMFAPGDLDNFHWHRVGIRNAMMFIRTADDSMAYFHLKVDTAGKYIMLSTEEKDSVAYFQYHAINDDLVLTGDFYNKKINVSLKKKDINQYPLINHKFRWISEYPDNR